jgi:hypothetical protein
MFVITDHKIQEQSISSLKVLGFEPVLMQSSPFLQPGVSSHTDMLLFMGFGHIFCHESYYSANNELIDSIVTLSSLSLALSNEDFSSEYPNDVLFNAVKLGNKLICNKKTVSRLILDAAEENGCDIINVPQGYTKCSVCAVTDNAIITSDKAIHTACSALGIDSLLITVGNISLPPYDYGFIGGASGAYLDKVYFCGDLSAHPDGATISNYCKLHGKEAVSLSKDKLQDVGSLFFI